MDKNDHRPDEYEEDINRGERHMGLIRVWHEEYEFIHTRLPLQSKCMTY
jgi:hypothetical protein